MSAKFSKGLVIITSEGATESNVGALGGKNAVKACAVVWSLTHKNVELFQFQIADNTLLPMFMCSC